MKSLKSQHAMMLSASLSLFLSSAAPSQSLDNKPQNAEPYPKPTDFIPTPKGPDSGAASLPKAPAEAQKKAETMQRSSSAISAQAIHGAAVYAAVAENAEKIAALGEAPLEDKNFDKIRKDRRPVGKVHDLLIDTDGKIASAIIDVGGVLGIGQRSVLVAWSDLTIVRLANGDVAAIADKTVRDFEIMLPYSAPKP